MPRPRRDGWEPVTITVSTEAAERLRQGALAQRTYMGTLVSDLVMKNIERDGAPKSKADPGGGKADKKGARSTARSRRKAP